MSGNVMRAGAGMTCAFAVVVMTVGCGQEPGDAAPGVVPAKAAPDKRSADGNGGAQGKDGASREPGSVAKVAAEMPEIKKVDGVVTLPMSTEGAVAWRGIREGVAVERKSVGEGEAAADAVVVKYKRTRKQAAGAAMVVKPGTLAGLTRLELRMRDTRTQRLIVSMKDTKGVVWSLPGVQLPADESAERVLKVEEIESDAFQNPKPVTSKFDAAEVVMITVLDIGGYMSIDEPECEWRIESVKGVCK